MSIIFRHKEFERFFSALPKLSVMSLGAPFYYVYAFRLVTNCVLLSCGIRVRYGRHRW